MNRNQGSDSNARNNPFTVNSSAIVNSSANAIGGVFDNSLPFLHYSQKFNDDSVLESSASGSPQLTTSA